MRQQPSHGLSGAPCASSSAPGSSLSLSAHGARRPRRSVIGPASRAAEAREPPPAGAYQVDKPQQREPTLICLLCGPARHYPRYRVAASHWRKRAANLFAPQRTPGWTRQRDWRPNDGNFFAAATRRLQGGPCHVPHGVGKSCRASSASCAAIRHLVCVCPWGRPPGPATVRGLSAR